LDVIEWAFLVTVQFIDMKWIIVVSRYLPENVGGNIVYVRMFAEELVKCGDSVHIVTTTRKKELPSLETGNGITIHRVYVARGNMGPLWFKYSKRVTQYIKDLDAFEKFDCVNLHGPFTVNTRALRKGLFVLYTLHAVVSYEYVFRLKKILIANKISVKSGTELLKAIILFPLHCIREWLCVRRANLVVVMSHYVKGTVKRYLPGVCLDRVIVSKIGVPSHFVPTSNKKQLKRELNLNHETCLLTVRRLEDRMGLENLLAAIHLLSQDNLLGGVKLYIIGKGSLREKLERLIKGCNIEKYVELLGFVEDTDLLRWYQACDVFVMPTEELEGFGISTIEAFAAGMPVVATSAGANPEVAGKLCPELITQSRNDPSELAEKIEYYLQKKVDYMSIDYSSMAKEEFNWEDIIKDIKSHLPDYLAAG